MIQELFVNSTIVITFISVGNLLFKEPEMNSELHVASKISAGIAAGLLGILLMLYSFHINATVLMDFRYIPIILVAVYGGTESALIAGIIIGIFRILFFGISSASITAVISILLISVCCGIISKLDESYKRILTLSVFATLLISSIGFAINIDDLSVLGSTIVIYWAGTILISIFIFYYTNFLGNHNKLFKKLKHESSSDYLTGLNNVRRFDNAFNKLIINAKGQNKKLSLLFIDIDFFKKVNDEYGHTNGDIVLKQLSYILKSSCRTVDIVSRNGGEEFSVLLFDCSSTNAFKMAEKIRSEVESSQFRLSNDQYVKITVSVGVATYPDTTSNPSKLVEQADEALYAAKHTGRNRVIISGIL
jgi:diguanylate cyclase